MKIFGYVMLLCGFAGLLFAAATFVGATNLQPSKGAWLLFLSVAMISSGWKFRAPGVQPSTTATMAAPGAPPDLTSEGTFKIPLSPEVSSLIDVASARQRRIALIILAVCVAVGQIFGIVSSAQAGSKALMIYFFASGMVTVVGLIFLIPVIIMYQAAKRDRRDGFYCRTNGPIRLDAIRGGYILQMLERSFSIDAKRVAPHLAPLDWASIDYSRHAHVIFQARDREGNSVYRLDGYNAGAVAASA